MKQTRSSLVYVSSAIALSGTALGWAIFIGQLATDDWVSGGGTAWMLVLAALATVGVVTAIPALWSGRHGWAAVGLAITAVSPTVFAYPLNVLLLILAVVEATHAISATRRVRSFAVR